MKQATNHLLIACVENVSDRYVATIWNIMRFYRPIASDSGKSCILEVFIHQRPLC